MDPDEKGYVKASDYDLPKQRRNHRVFLDRLRRRPALAVMVALVFAALGVWNLSLSSGAAAPFRAWAVSALAFAVVVYLLAVTFFFRRDS